MTATVKLIIFLALLLGELLGGTIAIVNLLRTGRVQVALMLVMGFVISIVVVGVILFVYIP